MESLTQFPARHESQWALPSGAEAVQPQAQVHLPIVSCCCRREEDLGTKRGKVEVDIEAVLDTRYSFENKIFRVMFIEMVLM